MRISKSEQKLLREMVGGHLLKSHRDIEGAKSYRIHAPDGGSQLVESGTVNGLKKQGLVDSNKKFPVATLWITEKGWTTLREIE